MDTNKTMTMREFYEVIVKAEISDEITAKAQAEIDKLDKRNSDRKEKPSKTAQANEPLNARILEFLGTHTTATAPELAAELGVTTQKASGLCVQLVKNGRLNSTEIKIPKKGKCKAYSLKIEG